MVGQTLQVWFQIHYKKGKERSAIDALSQKFKIQSYAISSHIPNCVDPIKSKILAKPHLQDLVEKIKEGEALRLWLFKGGLVLFKDWIYLSLTPKSIL